MQSSEVTLTPSSGVPTAACDCHVHLFLPRRFPYAPRRRYTPPAATLEELAATERRLGFERVVLVQPSCYGDDNAALLHGLAQLGECARGVAVVDPARIDDETLNTFHDAGVRGLRFNLSVQDGCDADALKRSLDGLEAQLVRRGWHLQFHADPGTMAALAPILRTRTVPVVLDHFGGGAPAADLVADLLEAPHVWVKLSAPYRVSTTPDYADLDAVLTRFLSIAPDRLVWASDWPHTGGQGVRGATHAEIEPFRDVDDAALFGLLARWVGDDGQRRRILVDNPAALYGFASGAAARGSSS